MEPIKNGTKPKSPLINRIAISEDCISKLDTWTRQMEGRCPGISLKRQHLVEWLIGEKNSELSPSDQISIQTRFYDDIELTLWALEQLRAAKARNEKLTLVELLQVGSGSGTPLSKKAKAKKATSRARGEDPQIEEGALTEEIKSN